MSLCQYMDYNSINTDTQARVKRYYNYLWSRTKGIDSKSIFEDFPVGFQAELALDIHGKLLAKVPLFHNAEVGFMRMLSLALQPLLFLPMEYVIRKGDIGTEMFFIQKGSVDVVSDDGNTVFASMLEGSFFGEIALFFSRPRTANIRCATYCDIYVLSKADLNAVLEFYPAVRESIINEASERLQANIQRNNTSPASQITIPTVKREPPRAEPQIKPPSPEVEKRLERGVSSPMLYVSSEGEAKKEKNSVPAHGSRVLLSVQQNDALHLLDPTVIASETSGISSHSRPIASMSKLSSVKRPSPLGRSHEESDEESEEESNEPILLTLDDDVDYTSSGIWKYSVAHLEPQEPATALSFPEKAAFPNPSRILQASHSSVLKSRNILETPLTSLNAGRGKGDGEGSQRHSERSFLSAEERTKEKDGSIQNKRPDAREI